MQHRGVSAMALCSSFALTFASALTLAGCGASGSDGAGEGGATACAEEELRCAPLFGRPGPSTGLEPSQCQPRLTCNGQDWTAPEVGEAFFGQLLAYELIDPFAPLEEDPYASPPAAVPADLCAAVFEEGTNRYRLESFSSEAAAAAAGARVTHFDACGLCSTLQDLEVYARVEDLTEPVRDCGLAHLSDTIEALTDCIEALGFTRPCAQIWAYNTTHTREVCTAPCFAAIGEPYHHPDGRLNDCLLCDEERSGDVFKAVAGRTRRNTGLPNAMCRPCEEVRPVEHAYP